MTTTETDDSWRLYHREWVIVHTISNKDVGPSTLVTEAAGDWIIANLDGRVRSDDIKLESHGDLDDDDLDGRSYWIHIKVFKDNLKGEFKYPANARMFAKGQGYEEYVIVPRNSKSDHDIRSYGVKML